LPGTDGAYPYYPLGNLLQFVGDGGIEHIDINGRGRAGQNSGVRRLNTLPSGDGRCLAVDWKREVARRKQALSDCRGAIEPLPRRFTFRQLFELVEIVRQGVAYGE
jgi:hypothetical protein